jgi:hypothetical protein
MKADIRQYVEAYASARRMARGIARHDTEWVRWVRRVELARRLRDATLAQAAIQRALIYGEAAAQLRMQHAEQEAEVRRLAVLARFEP